MIEPYDITNDETYKASAAFLDSNNIVSLDTMKKIFGNQEGFSLVSDELYNTTTNFLQSNNIIDKSTLNMITGSNNGIETFDTTLLPDQFYSETSTFASVTPAKMKLFIQNLDKPIKDMSIPELDDRIAMLRSLKDAANKYWTQNPIPGNLPADVKLNLMSLQKLILRTIDLASSHTTDVKASRSTNQSIEMFTVQPIIANIPASAIADFNMLLARYNLSYNTVIDFLNNFDLAASQLNSQQKIVRLRILSLAKQLLYIINGFDVAVQKANAFQNPLIPPPGTVRFLYIAADYVLDMYLRELYKTMTRNEITIGLYFEKFLPYYAITSPQIADLQQKLTQSQQLLDAAKLEANNAALQLKSVSQQLQAKTNELDTLKTTASNSNSQLTSLTQQIATLTQQLTSKTQELETTKTASAAVTSQVNLLTQQITDKTRELQSSKTNATGLASQITTLTQQLASKTQDLETAKSNAASLTTQVATLTQQLSDKTKETDTAKSSSAALDAQVAKLTTQYNDKVKELESLRSILTITDEASAKELAGKITQWQSDISNLKTQIDTLKATQAKLASAEQTSQGYMIAMIIFIILSVIVTVMYIRK